MRLPSVAVAMAWGISVCALSAEASEPPATTSSELEKSAPDPAAVADGIPHLEWGKEVWCVRDRQGARLRVQCNEQALGGPACLVAKDSLLDSGELSRTQDCVDMGTDGYDRMVAGLYRQIPAIAEAPPGWRRDEKGRVFQVTFDLLDRLYLGAGWQPRFDLSGGNASLGQVRFDLGFSASVLIPKALYRHDFRAVEGMVTITDLEVSGLLFAYDLSHRSHTPFLWITTFVGQPARHDLYMDIGTGLRLLDVRLHPHQAKDLLDVEFGELHLAWDIWQSEDLLDHLRLESGVGIGGLYDGKDRGNATVLLPDAALVARFCLDPDGFHNLSARLFWAKPVALSGSRLWADWTRVGIAAAYELIFLAVNDQPLTLRLEAQADYRDDLGKNAYPFEATVMAGVRFSFWAPALVRHEQPNG